MASHMARDDARHRIETAPRRRADEKGNRLALIEESWRQRRSHQNKKSKVITRATNKFSLEYLLLCRQLFLGFAQQSDVSDIDNPHGRSIFIPSLP